MQSNTLFDFWIRLSFDTKFTFSQYWKSACFPLLHDCMSENIYIMKRPPKNKKPSQAEIPLHPRGTCILSFYLLLRLSLTPLPFCVSGSSSILTFFQFCGYLQSFFTYLSYPSAPCLSSVVWDSPHVQSLKVRMEQQTDEVFLLMSSLRAPGCCVGV